MKAIAGAQARARIALNGEAQNALMLLKMSAAEVRAEISRHLADNPFLEDDAFADDFHLSGGAMPGAFDAETDAAAVPDLRDSLRLQARAANVDDDARRALFALIALVDDDGFLRADAADLNAAFAGDAKAAAKLPQARAALCEMAPAGVGAADLRESLLLQLNGRDGEDAAAARTILRSHFDDLAKRRFDRLPRRQREAALALIQSLSPRPGAGFVADDAARAAPPPAAPPDVVFVKARGLWRATAGPGLRAGVRLAAAIGGGIKLNRALAEKRTGARVFVRHLAWRERTVLAAARVIADAQAAFLDHGESRLVPLPMRAVAARLGVSAATTSVALAGKTALTPRGVFALKFLCARAARDGASAAAARCAIRDIISCEDGRNPLSDAGLAAALHARGIGLSRRAAAAHRAASGILPARLRRRLISKGIQ